MSTKPNEQVSQYPIPTVVGLWGFCSDIFPTWSASSTSFHTAQAKRRQKVKQCKLKSTKPSYPTRWTTLYMILQDLRSSFFRADIYQTRRELDKFLISFQRSRQWFWIHSDGQSAQSASILTRRTQTCGSRRTTMAHGAVAAPVILNAQCLENQPREITTPESKVKLCNFNFQGY